MSGATDPEAHDSAGREIARLLLGVMEVLRELMELQSIRHLEAGRLSAAEEDRLSAALEAARAQIRAVAAEFGFDETDLQLDLGKYLSIETSSSDRFSHCSDIAAKQVPDD